MLLLKFNNKGLTLIEVIVTLAIVSIVGVIIWSVFLQGNKFSQQAMTKNAILQELNILTSNLNRQHQTLSQYDLKSENCSIKLINTTGGDKIFDSSNVCFTILEINGVAGPGPKTVKPNVAENDISLKIKANDKKNTANSITIKTYLYRIKGVDYK